MCLILNANVNPSLQTLLDMCNEFKRLNSLSVDMEPEEDGVSVMNHQA